MRTWVLDKDSGPREPPQQVPGASAASVNVLSGRGGPARPGHRRHCQAVMVSRIAQLCVFRQLSSRESLYARKAQWDQKRISKVKALGPQSHSPCEHPLSLNISTKFLDLTTAPTALAKPHGHGSPRVPYPSILSSFLLTPRHLPLPPDSHCDGDLVSPSSFPSMFPSVQPTSLFLGQRRRLCALSLSLWKEAGGLWDSVIESAVVSGTAPGLHTRSPLTHSNARPAAPFTVSALHGCTVFSHTPLSSAFSLFRCVWLHRYQCCSACSIHSVTCTGLWPRSSRLYRGAGRVGGCALWAGVRVSVVFPQDEAAWPRISQDVPRR